MRVSDEPGLGTTDYCCTFTVKGRERKTDLRPRVGFYSTTSIARSLASVHDVHTMNDMVVAGFILSYI